jgi:hypothetical protein
VVARRQLLALGFNSREIEHRIATRRLHLVMRGVYAVGWPRLTQKRRWMAAVLACGEGAMLSHRSAAALWGIGNEGGVVDVSVRRRAELKRSGLHVRGRSSLAAENVTTLDGILFRPIASEAGLPPPLTKEIVNGWEVDFYWPDLGLVIETDGLRYHRTASSQTRDARRDRAHVIAGMSSLRFTHYEVKHEAARVRSELARAARTLRKAPIRY